MARSADDPLTVSLTALPMASRFALGSGERTAAELGTARILAAPSNRRNEKRTPLEGALYPESRILPEFAGDAIGELSRLSP